MARKRNIKSKQDEKKEENLSQRNEETTANQSPPLLSYKRMVTRMIIVAGTMIAARYFFGEPNETLAKASEVFPRKSMNVTCSKDYDQERLLFKKCSPKVCSRVVMDGVISEYEAKSLLKIAKKGLSFGGGSGGASILDLHSGALSKGEKFINIYSILDKGDSPFTREDFNLYKKIREKIQFAIADEFGIPSKVLYLTKPTFFSKMTPRPAKTAHDEYWHPHVDKVTYGSFHYTSLLYLSDYGTDFEGGRFIFLDKSKNITVEPKLARLSFFTSASENVHHVEKVSSGTRYAVTVSFTCDPSKAIGDPTLGS